MKGALIDFPFLLTATIGIIVTGVILLQILVPLMKISEMDIGTSKDLQKLMLFQNIITSKNCLGTGNTGVLNYSSLKKAQNTKFWECTEIPYSSYYIIVKDLQNDREFKFGVKPFNYKEYDNFERFWHHKTYHVGIKYPTECSSGKLENCKRRIHPAKISFYPSYEKKDRMLMFASLAEKTLKRPGDKVNTSFVPKRNFKLIFKEDKICTSKNICKPLYNVKLKEETYEITTGEYKICTLKYEVIEKNKIDPDVKCYNKEIG